MDKQIGNFLVGEQVSTSEFSSQTSDTKLDEQKNEYNNKGIEFFDKGDYESALIYFNKALELIPSDNHLHVNKGTTLNLIGMDNYKQGNYVSALIYFNNALEFIPDNENIQKKHRSNHRTNRFF